MTYQELMAASRKAFQAGDVKGALRLSDAAEAQRAATLAPEAPAAPSGPPQVPEGFFLNPVTGQMTSRELMRNNIEPSQSRAVLGGAMQGVGFNFGDELIGAAGYLQGGPDMARYRMEQARATLEADKAAFPKTAVGSEIAGALVPAIASAPLAAGRGLASMAGRGLGIGTVEGGLFGAGRGEGLEDRLKTAGKDAVIGGAVGGVAPLAVRGATSAFNAAKNPVVGLADSAINRASPGRANQAILSTLRRSKQSPDDVMHAVSAARAQGQPEFRIMDALGEPGARRASGVVRHGGEGGEELAEFLKQRQIDQSSRVAQQIEEALGFPAQSGAVAKSGASGPPSMAEVLAGRQTTAAKTAEALRTARGQAADINYPAARAGAKPVDTRPALSIIEDRLAPMRGSGVKGDKIDDMYQRWSARLQAPEKALGEGELSRELSDFDRVLGVKQELSDEIAKARRAGSNNLARKLGELNRALDSALEESSDLYRRANDTFREQSGVMEAVGEGAGFAKRGRAADTTEAFGRMTADEQAAARIGYGDQFLDKLERNAAETADFSRPLRSTKVREETGTVALDPERLAAQTGREKAMFETQQRALRGSMTASNIEDVADTAGAGVGILKALKSGGVTGALGHAAEGLAPYAKGQNAATRKLIADILMSDDAGAALASALLQDQRSNTGQVAASAIARAITQRTR
jgi:hypothetical protein